MNYKDKILWYVSNEACKEVSTKVVRSLRKMTEGMQSGDDTTTTEEDRRSNSELLSSDANRLAKFNESRSCYVAAPVFEIGRYHCLSLRGWDSISLPNSG